MSADAKEEHAADAKGGGGKKKPKLILILAGGLILGGGGFAGFLFLKGGSSSAATTEAASAEHGKEGEKKEEGHGGEKKEGEKKEGEGHGGEKKGGEKVVAAGNDKRGRTKVVTREPAVVNLRDSKGTRYLKVRIGLEITDEKVADEMRTLDPQLSDFINEKLSTCDISQIDNVAGRNRLRRELLSGINEILQTGVVERIYFTEFVIQ